MGQMTSKGRPEILQAGRGTWIPINTLEEYTLDTELIIDITMTARQKQIARERFTMIAPLLAFLTDDKERNRIMTRIAEEREISKQTLRRYLCRYLVYQDIQVQEEMVRRARLETGTGKRRVYSGKYALSHLVYCAHCGDIYRRTQWWILGEKIPVWRCISRIEKRKANVDCPSRTIYEKDMHAAVVTAFNQLIAQKDEFLPGMKLAMKRAMLTSNSPRVKEMDERLEALQKELLRGRLFLSAW